MNILLKKVRVKTLFSRFEPIKVEPLELCYLKTVCDEMGHKSYILDELFEKQDIIGFIPNIIIITGYNVAENRILEEAKGYKRLYPHAKIIVGGLHIQLNVSSFHNENIDYVIHSPSLEVFKHILKLIGDEKSTKTGEESHTQGYDYRRGKVWVIGSKALIDSNEGIYPNREFFYKNKNLFHYLDKRGVALIKGSIGCPYECSYCYCRELNGGKYIKGDFSKMIREMCQVNAEYFWIVDDVLFVSGQDVNAFVDEAQEHNFKKKFIAYLRADFIIREEDKLDLLKKAGLKEVIIGFEAITESELNEYNKGSSSLDYPKVISILKESQIDYTALFMVRPEYGTKDFLKLYKFIRDNDIEIFTLSIFTPLKGLRAYEHYELITKAPEKFDFLHLVTKSRLPKPLFYILFYSMHLRMLRSKRIRKFLFRRRT